MLNLLIGSDKDAWSESSALLKTYRCFTEYISPELKKRYAKWTEENREEIKKIPCLFAYEKAIN